MDSERVRSRVGSFFEVYDVQEDDDGEVVKLYGVPLVEPEEVQRRILDEFREESHEIELRHEYGEHVIVAEPSEDEEFPWRNVVLAVLTVLTTLFAGSFWYSANPFENPLSVLRGWPFVVSVMGVLGAHEFGHYVMSRYHGVDATLPYFIPFPSPIGTMGAVIRVKGAIPDRKALFDIGIAGPLLGLVATVVVTAVGLQLPPVETAAPTAGGSGEAYIRLHFPPLYDIIESAVGAPAGVEDENVNPNPVVIGGWVGMFVTFLNLLPAGQLDGGHIVKSVFGDLAQYVSYAVPAVLFGLGTYVEVVQNSTGTIWFVWGVLTLLVTSMGSARPLDEKGNLGRKRLLLAVVVFVLGALSFTPIPIDIVSA